MAVKEYPPAKRPILILTSAFGEGHNAAARNLAAALRLQDPERDVAVHDLFAEAYGPLYSATQQGYFFLINHLPSLWGAFYKHLHQDKAMPRRVAVYRRAARLLQKTIARMLPSLVVSTYPGYNHLLDHLHTDGDRPFKTVTVVTDSISINSMWYSGHSDFFLLPNEITASVMEDAGVDRKKLRVTGFPVPSVFSTLRGQRMSPGPNNRPKVLFLVNPGQKHAVEILKTLGDLPEIELVAACGRDENLRRTLQRTADRLSHPILIQGWINDLPERLASSHLVVAKAGGATVQECLAAGTPLVMSQVIPGQEEGNAQLLTSSDCGCLATSPRAVSSAVKHAFSHGYMVWKTWEANAWKTGKPEGALDSAREILREGGLDD